MGVTRRYRRVSESCSGTDACHRPAGTACADHSPTARRDCDLRGGHRPVRLLCAGVGDLRGRVGRRVQRARGLGPGARQLAAARVDADRRLLLHHRAARVRGRRAGPGARRGRGAHQRRDHLHAAGARGGRPRPGPGPGRRGLGAGADRGRDHARAAARQRRPRAPLPAGPRRHPGAGARDLPAHRPRPPPLVHGGRDLGVADAPPARCAGSGSSWRSPSRSPARSAPPSSSSSASTAWAGSP
jgi:hypothetical protein